MAFRSLTNTTDYNNYTKQYLDNLALQIQLNQNNFNKNIAYMKTGSQDTERTDSRSIEERAADVETLKVQARVMLNKISDATNSNEVLDYLVKNGDLLFFFIQQFPSIEKIVKEQFSGGIRAPLLISLIYKRFTAQQEETLLPESEDFQVVQNTLTKEDIDDIINNTANPRLIMDLRRVKGDLPLKSDIMRISSDPIKYQAELKAYADKYRDGLTREDINKIIETANDAPIQDTNQAVLDAENELVNKVNDYLASNSNIPLVVPKPRSSVAKKISPPPSDKSITAFKTTDVKLAEKAIRTEQLAKQNQQNILAQVQQKQQEKIAKQNQQQLETQQAKQRAKLQSDLILKAKAQKQVDLINQSQIEQAKLVAEQQKAASEYAQFIKELEDEIEQDKLAQSTTPVRPFQKSPSKKSVSSSSKPKIIKVYKNKGTGLLNDNEQTVHRFKVLKGELLAGNTSKSVVKEMKSLVKQLVQMGELTNDQRLLILKDLKTV